MEKDTTNNNSMSKAEVRKKAVDAIMKKFNMLTQGKIPENRRTEFMHLINNSIEKAQI